jgi:hypothetical protein
MKSLCQWVSDLNRLRKEITIPQQIQGRPRRAGVSSSRSSRSRNTTPTHQKLDTLPGTPSDETPNFLSSKNDSPAKTIQQQKPHSSKNHTAAKTAQQQKPHSSKTKQKHKQKRYSSKNHTAAKTTQQQTPHSSKNHTAVTKKHDSKTHSSVVTVTLTINFSSPAHISRQRYFD